MYAITPFDIPTFLSQFWQKKPCVIKASDLALPPINFDEHDLAGLAQEDDVDSRIIAFHPDTQKWQLEHGPFDDFTPYCQGLWTLLVQGIDRYFDDASELIEAFNFVPYWRMDDVMASYSVPGAGVGPHVDQYDVFLINQAGKRRWRVGMPSEDSTIAPTSGLHQVPPFEAIIDNVLSTGDILYIPPGWPHEGVTVEDCLTLSVGFRAPDVSDIAATLETSTIANEHSPSTLHRFTDPHLTLREHPSLVTDDEINTLRQMLVDQLHQPQWQHALLRLLSQQQLPHFEEDVEERLLISIEDVEHALESGAQIEKVAACRPLVYPGQTEQEFFTFYIDGEEYTACSSCEEPLMKLFSGQALTKNDVLNQQFTLKIINIVTTLIHSGAVILQE